MNCWGLEWRVGLHSAFPWACPGGFLVVFWAGFPSPGSALPPELCQEGLERQTQSPPGASQLLWCPERSRNSPPFGHFVLHRAPGEEIVWNGLCSPIFVSENSAQSDLCWEIFPLAEVVGEGSRGRITQNFIISCGSALTTLTHTAVNNFLSKSAQPRVSPAGKGAAELGALSRRAGCPWGAAAAQTGGAGSCSEPCTPSWEWAWGVTWCYLPLKWRKKKIGYKN